VNQRFNLLVSKSDRSVFKAFLKKVFEGRAKESCEVTLRNERNRLPSSQYSGGEPLRRSGRLSIQIEGTVGEEEQTCRVVVLDITDRKMIEDAHSFLLQSGWSGEDFFQSLARYLAETLGMDYVCIDRLEGDSLSAQTLALIPIFIGSAKAASKLPHSKAPFGLALGASPAVFSATEKIFFAVEKMLSELN
jgi:hypothetical protein